jgi:Family of unknown function (DUF6526)
MAPQRFENHAHQPLATIVGYLFVIVAMTGFVLRWLFIGGRSTFALGLLGLTGAVLTLLYISRVYTTRLQDRIIKLEMRVRTQSLLSLEQQRRLFELDNKRIAALRFASDAELPALLDRAVRDNLKPTDIKRAVTAWVPDNDRT